MKYPSTVRESKKRSGVKPETSAAGPHSQLTQQSSAIFWNALVERTKLIPNVMHGVSSVSPRTSIALLFDDLTAISLPESSLSSKAPLEPVHIHGPHDTSLHLCLPLDRAQEVCELGWGEPHQFADFGTQIMIYGPRDELELETVLGFIQESLAFARGGDSKS